MKMIKLIFLVIFFSYSLLTAKDVITIPIYNITDTCRIQPKIFFINIDSDYEWDIIFFDKCGGKPLAYSIIDNSQNKIITEQTATLTQGILEARNFLILIYNPNTFRNTHKLYYDNQLSKVVLEDYTDNGSEPSTYEEADNYFYTQQMGSIFLVTKKADIDVQSVYLCSLDGRIISNMQNVEGWSQFSFDMSLEPSGMYLLRFIANDRAMSKRIIYFR